MLDSAQLSPDGVGLSRAIFIVPSVTQKRNIILTNAHSLTNWGSKLVKVGGQGGGGQSNGNATVGTSSKPPSAASPALAPTSVGSPPPLLLVWLPLRRN
jgi:hypothetical protein